MPEEVEQQANKELRRLERMPEAAAEHGMLRSYLDTLIELPWSKSTEDRIDVPEAQRVLDEDHYDLEKIKKRIIEYLAVRKLAPEGRSPILCFVGPPGVGKTSLGQSIARAMGRKFARVSLGGVHDESEIRGHRRTYVGALPGNIIQAIRKVGVNNPVMMLDEMDKLGTGFQGDPSAALLEVLDPEQNSTFRDAYLAVPFDLSHVLFIGTANMLDTIPGPLRDRMEVIELPSYTEDEKVGIARRFLMARQLKATGLTSDQADVTDDGLHHLVRDYTREAGVRNLERTIGAVLRSVAVRVAEGRTERTVVDTPDLEPILGGRRFESEVAERTSVAGVATGLAWTPVGGDILFVEATRIPGKGSLILTGQLGDVMRESATAALSLVKSRRSGPRHRREAVREVRHPRPRAGRRHPQGRPFGRGRHVHRAGLANDQPQGPRRHRHDRRDQPARPCPAGRRHQAEGGGGPRRRDPPGAAAGAQPARLRRDPGRRQAGPGVRLVRAGRRLAERSAGGRARSRTGDRGRLIRATSGSVPDWWPRRVSWVRTWPTTSSVHLSTLSLLGFGCARGRIVRAQLRALVRSVSPH